MYIIDDVVGVEVVGVFKNVFVIVVGMGYLLGIGENICVLVIVCVLCEMMKLGVVMGGKSEMFFGLVGFGDLIVICIS